LINQTLESLVRDEAARQWAFPVAAERVYLGHAGVTALPRVASEALTAFAHAAARDNQESPAVWDQVEQARNAGAALVGGDADEIALLGPTALGLSLVANGLPWKAGDEVVFYRDDYPANVYPWRHLETLGVQAVALVPEWPGDITWPFLERHLTAKTRLVALASCHFLSGFRLDLDEIGRNLHERGILFCVDGIQTLGAFPLSVEHIDFVSADSHKWMLGPAGAGIVYVKREHHDFLRPTLLGSWNVVSPEFVAQERIAYYEGARRYEPGILNLPGIVAMEASLRLLLDVGIENVAQRILTLRGLLVEGLRPLGYRLYGPWEERDVDIARHASGIVTVTHPEKDLKALFDRLAANGVVASLRQDRSGQPLLRLAPHFYNTEAELERVLALLRA
jgi:selenocysteine lyase/cysteine desulfurase